MAAVKRLSFPHYCKNVYCWSFVIIQPIQKFVKYLTVTKEGRPNMSKLAYLVQITWILPPFLIPVRVCVCLLLSKVISLLCEY